MTQTSGDERVDAVVSELGRVDGLDLPAQLAAFAEAQARLAAVLDSGDEPPAAT